MDLVKEFKTAVKNPLNFKNLFVIFFTIFLILIVGLSMIAIFKKISVFSDKTTACDIPKSITTKGSALVNKNAIYELNFKGNNNCFLQVWFTWKKTTQKVDLWVYDPNGNVNIVEPTKSQANLNLTLNAPLTKGNWRFILKSKSSVPVGYNGEIAVR